MSEFYEKNWMINPSRSLNLLQKYLLYLFPIICYASDVKLSYVRMISLFIFTVIFCLCKKGSSCDSVTKANKPLALIIPVLVTAATPHVAQWPRLYDRHTDGVSSLWNTVTQRLRHRKSAVTESITKKTGQTPKKTAALKSLKGSVRPSAASMTLSHHSTHFYQIIWTTMMDFTFHEHSALFNIFFTSSEIISRQTA